MLSRAISVLFFVLLTASWVHAKEVTKQNQYVEAQVVERTQPKYPRANARRADEGWVDLIFTVGDDSVVRDIEVTGHSGVDGFVKPAIKAVSEYTYKPATLDGKTV